ncbi:MAG: iron-sulfur cluster-binding domain-containing protein, partial [Myxococcota bacterium]
GGRVSGWMHDHLQVGDIVLLGEPMGTFVMPEEGVPERMLWIAGGSGVTPMLAMADALAERPEIKTSLVILYYARSRQDRIGYTRLRQAVSQIEGAQMVSICDDDPAGPGGFDEAHVRALVPDFAERHTWLCGPPGLMRCVEAMWTSAQALSLLQTERFTAPRPPTVDERPSTATPGELQQQTVSVTLAGRGRVVTANAQATLLEQLEQAGERPAHGCRMGICQSCRCRKVSGVVEDTLTGTLSREPDETIQLCISVPRSDLVLELHNTSRNPS